MLGRGKCHCPVAFEWAVCVWALRLSPSWQASLPWLFRRQLNETCSIVGIISISNSYFFSFYCLLNSPLLQGQCEKFFLFSAADPVTVGNLTQQGYGTGVLSNIPQSQCTNIRFDGYVPYFEQRADLLTMEDEIYAEILRLLLSFWKSWPQLLRYNKISPKNMYESTYDFMLPDGYAVEPLFFSLQSVHCQSFDEMHDTSFKATLSVNTNPTLNYHRKNNFTRIDFTLPPKLKASDTLKRMQLIILEVCSNPLASELTSYIGSRTTIGLCCSGVH